MDEEEYSFKEAIDLYFGKPKLTAEEEKLVDEMLKEMKENGFLEKCKEMIKQREKKVIRIGRLCISKVACVIFVICFSTVLIGGIAYAAVQKNIQSIQIKDMGDHSEVDLEYNDTTGLNLSKIEDYYKPAWIPDGYYIESEFKFEEGYSIVYSSEESENTIIYQQYLPKARPNYSTENSKPEKVSFGIYTGEFVETNHANYLIVTDGTYIYSLIAYNICKDDLAKMING